MLLFQSATVLACQIRCRGPKGHAIYPPLGHHHGWRHVWRRCPVGFAAPIRQGHLDRGDSLEDQVAALPSGIPPGNVASIQCRGPFLRRVMRNGRPMVFAIAVTHGPPRIPGATCESLTAAGSSGGVPSTSRDDSRVGASRCHKDTAAAPADAVGTVRPNRRVSAHRGEYRVPPRRPLPGLPLRETTRQTATLR